MNFKRTTIIPLDDKELAKSIFDAFINKEFMILMIILGDNESIRESLPRADNLATQTYFNMERWVLWVRDYDILADSLKNQLEKKDESGEEEVNYNDVKCFCFSPILDEAAGVILKNGRLSYLTLQNSFFRAQNHDLGAISL